MASLGDVSLQPLPCPEASTGSILPHRSPWPPPTSSQSRQGVRAGVEKGDRPGPVS